MKSKIRSLGYRRKIKGRTNYKKRLNLVKSYKPRLVVRRSNKNIIAQIVEYYSDGDKIILGVSSKDLKKFGWKGSGKNICAAYLVGYLCGRKSKIKEVIFDIGLENPAKKGVLYSCLKGALDAGLKIPHSKDILPSEDIIKGKSIENYFKRLNEEGKKNNFSKYIKEGFDVGDIAKIFVNVKESISKI